MSTPGHCCVQRIERTRKTDGRANSIPRTRSFPLPYHIGLGDLESERPALRRVAIWFPRGKSDVDDLLAVVVAEAMKAVFSCAVS